MKVTLGIADDLYVNLRNIKTLDNDKVSDENYDDITEFLNKSDPALDSELNLKDLYLLLKILGTK